MLRATADDVGRGTVRQAPGVSGGGPAAAGRRRRFRIPGVNSGNDDGASAPRASSRGLIILSYALIVGFLAVDWATPPGIVVAILLSIPFMLLALLDDARQLWIAGAVAVIGRFADMLVGSAPTIPRAIWLPNRILTTVAVIGSIAIAHLLLRQRASAQRARDAALRARDMNRLLVSLMAHDLRTPLVVANDALAYAQRSAGGDDPVDTTLLSDARVRLERSLRTVESILTVARGEVVRNHDGSAVAEARTATSLRRAVTSEIASFAPEAAARGRPLVCRVGLPHDVLVTELDARVVRQGLAILLDNAIRYADPGPIKVDVFARASDICVRVADGGPGLTAACASQTAPAFMGSGLGLELCRALLNCVGARLELERDSAEGTVFVLRLPARSS